MKRFFLFLAAFFSFQVFAQFDVIINASESFTPKEVYIYTLNGSKDILFTKEVKKNNQWKLRYPKNYIGMMKAYFPEINYSLNFVSENKDVNIKIESSGSRVTDILYLDEANSMMNSNQDLQRKRETILPVLYQMKEFYKPSADFYKAIDKEILNLSSANNILLTKYPFIDYYSKNYNKYLTVSASNPQPSQEEIINFISNSNEYLETSSLLRPLLVSFLEGSGTSPEASVDKLLERVNLESPRGQTVLSELIELFDVYSRKDLKDKYLTQAKNLKCTINERLASTIDTSNKTEVGSTFENYVFTKPVNTTSKSIHDVKADKKIIVFWSSTCSHCETELPQFIPYYNQLKSKNIEIIGLSLDVDANSFNTKAKAFPWINDTELRGWYSTFSDKYNVHATPSYFILDKNNKIIAKPDHNNDALQFLGVK